MKTFAFGAALLAPLAACAIAINPTPRQIVENGDSLSVAGGYAMDAKGSALQAADFDWLQAAPKGAKLSLAAKPGTAKSLGMPQAKGAYALEITPAGVSIAADDDQGLFYGMQTLRQIASQCGDKLPQLSILDYPALPNRGIVEGFYGTPWSHEKRLSMIDFMGRNKMNYYVYGPKDDPYHRSPHWRHPYPEDQARHIAELAEASRRNHVKFVWALHPGLDITWSAEDLDSLEMKLDQMYGLGVRSFAIFFDDVDGGPGSRTDCQVALLNSIATDYAAKKGDIEDLIICPNDYSKAWANPTPGGQLGYYGQHLDPRVTVFYTGDRVCSDLTGDTMDFVDGLIQRPAFFWWNFPVNDYCRDRLLMGPSYGFNTALTDKELYGVLSNPMEHAEASKLALYGVADYAWNPAAYNDKAAWERAIADLEPGAPQALRTFAIHSCDAGSRGYRREESWQTRDFNPEKYTDEQYEALMDEFRRVEAVEAELEANAANRVLLDELRPWLRQFTVLGKRGQRALELVKLRQSGTPEQVEQALKDLEMTPEEVAAFRAHRSGTVRLVPIIERCVHPEILVWE